ncbi:unnamed protein product, partial [Rotaria socialis]
MFLQQPTVTQTATRFAIQKHRKIRSVFSLQHKPILHQLAQQQPPPQQQSLL